MGVLKMCVTFLVFYTLIFRDNYKTCLKTPIIFAV